MNPNKSVVPALTPTNPLFIKTELGVRFANL